MTGDALLVERDDTVVTVTMNRPEKRNAITREMFGEIERVFGELGADGSCRAIVLTGAGGAFSSGADLTAGGEDTPTTGAGFHANMVRVGRAVEAVGVCPKPVIAAVDGVAVGAACNMALLCDIVLASDRARFSEIFVKRGMTLDGGGTWILPRLVGLQKAKELAFTADFVEAEEAVRIGLATRVVAHDRLLDEAVDLARRIAANAPIGVRLAKEGLNRSSQMSLADALSDEAQAQTVCLTSEDIQEGVLAFVERREPNFRGR